MNELNLENAVPIKALKQEYHGCKFAVQCDMGSVRDRQLANAIKVVLDWVETPVYQTRLECCGFKDRKAATNEELIKTMCTDDFNKFLFRFAIHLITCSLGVDGQKPMSAVELTQWLESDNKELLFKLMREE